MNEQTPTWTCPVCNRTIDNWEDLIVDEFFEEMLSRTPDHIDSVKVEPNGNITIIEASPDPGESDSESDGYSEPLLPVKSEETEHTTILLDDDDDGIEEVQVQLPPIENIVNSQQSIPSTSSSKKRNHSEITESSQNSSSQTPSSQKKQKTNVIDLTMDSSDDEDQPHIV